VLLDWILKNKDFISKSNLEDFPKALISCIQDKIPAIRSLAEAVIVEVVPFAGAAPFRKIITSDLKPAVQNTVKPVFEKCLSKSNIPEQETNDAPAAPVKNDQPAKAKGNKSNEASLKSSKANEASLKGKRPGTAAPITAKKIFEKLPKYQAGVGLALKSAPEEDKFVILDVGK
jgi:hypothetical protein